MAVLLTEDCEGGQNGWTESGLGTFNYADSVAGQQGSACFSIVSAATTDNIFKALSAADSPVYFHFMWRWASLSGTAHIFALRSTASIRLEITTSATGGLSFRHGTSGAFTDITDAVPVDTWVHIWGHYVQGTGADGHADVEWSTTTTRLGDTGSNTKYAETDVGTSTSTVDRAYIGSNANETLTEYFDHLIVDDAGYPSLSANVSIEVPVGSLSAAGVAAALITSGIVAMGLGSGVFSGYAPTAVVSAPGVTIEVPVGSVEATGQYVAVTFGGPGVGSVVATGYAPTVFVLLEGSALPGVGSLVATGHAPSLVMAWVITPPVGSITASGLAAALVDSGLATTSRSPRARGRGRGR